MKRILLFTDWYEPGFKAGGPIQSCRNFAGALREEFLLRIITSDRDQGDTQTYPGITPDAWSEGRTGFPVYYATPGHLDLHRLKQLIDEVTPDFIYLNSMYSFRFTILPLWLVLRGRFTGGVVIAPRGMLHEGALQFKPFKKKLFISLLNRVNLPSRLVFQATDEQERKDILRYFPSAGKVALLPNFTKMETVEWKRIDKNPGELFCVFISRIAPKKNILFLLEVLGQVPKDIRVRLDLYGEIEEEDYWKKCLSAIETLAPHITVRLKGPIPNDEVTKILQLHHIFVLPTLGENFGHAIFEAFLAGKPVLISDKTPWRDLVAKRVGYDLPLEITSFREALQRLGGMDQEEYDHWSRAAFAFAQEMQSNDSLKKKYIELFQ